VDGLDQMTRASKFLYLDWAQAKIIEHTASRIAAEHDGYRRLGVTHRRAVTMLEDGWRVEDDLISSLSRPAVFRLHWLLPDWEYEEQDSGSEIRLRSPAGWVRLRIQARVSDDQSSSAGYRISLVRGGQSVYGHGPVSPIFGWASPTYGVKHPALSLAVEVESAQDMHFTTQFTFPA